MNCGGAKPGQACAWGCHPTLPLMDRAALAAEFDAQVDTARPVRCCSAWQEPLEALPGTAFHGHTTAAVTHHCVKEAGHGGTEHRCEACGRTWPIL